MPDPLLQIVDLRKWFPVSQGFFARKRRYVHAVDGVSLTLMKGETIGVVGESGCGKTTLGKTIVRLVEPTGGKIIYEGNDITNIKGKRLRKYRKKMQIVFQDPYASLDPRQTVGSSIMEAFRIHGIVNSKDEAKERALALLEQVGLSREHFKRYPHEFSGGQRQRVAIARALAVGPEFLVLDEPTSSLDVSVQSQILNLLISLRERFKLTYLFISHNLAVVRQMCQRVAVMYLGRVVEIAETRTLFENPCHPYTYALLSSIPIADPNKKLSPITIEGDLPSQVDIPSGCRFRTRCRYATDLCKEREPLLIEVEKGHYVECHYDISFKEGLARLWTHS